MKYYSKDRFILIENEQGGWYEKAIFILNKDVHINKLNKRPKDIVLEAEKIVSDYMKRHKVSNSEPAVKTEITSKRIRKSHIDWILNFCLIVSILLFIYCTAQIFI